MRSESPVSFCDSRSVTPMNLPSFPPLALRLVRAPPKTPENLEDARDLEGPVDARIPKMDDRGMATEDLTATDALPAEDDLTAVESRLPCSAKQARGRQHCRGCAAIRGRLLRERPL